MCFAINFSSFLRAEAKSYGLCIPQHQTMNAHVDSTQSLFIQWVDHFPSSVLPLRSQGTSTWLSSQLRLWIILIPCSSGNWRNSTNKSRFSHYKIEHQLVSIQQWLLIHSIQRCSCSHFVLLLKKTLELCREETHGMGIKKTILPLLLIM